MTRDQHSEPDKASQTAPSSSKGAAEFKPFTDDTAALPIGGITIENSQERVSISGSLDLGADQKGHNQAKVLKAAIDAIITALETRGDLPETDSRLEAPVKRVRNPFG